MNHIENKLQAKMTPFATRDAPAHNDVYTGNLISEKASPIPPPYDKDLDSAIIIYFLVLLFFYRFNQFFVWFLCHWLLSFIAFFSF